MASKISAISAYLPHKVVTNEIINEQFPEWSAEKISSKIGIFNRREADEDEFVSDMAIKSALNLFKEHRIDKNDIDFVLLCTQSPDYFLPTTACIVQDKLGLKTSCGALDFNLGCSGYIYGLALAEGLISSGVAKNVLLITSETYTKHIHSEDKSNKTIFGDAATATLLSSEGKCEIKQFVLGTDGSGAENLIVKKGALKYNVRDGKNIYENGEFVKNDNNLFMDGQQIFQFTTKAVPELVKDTLAKNNLSINQIDLFIFHQANKFMLDYIRRKIKIPDENFFIHLEDVGNTVSSTIPIALQEAMNSGRIKKGMTVLIAGFGVGYSYGATILKF
ncbi:MAG TPA: ketoacyl-ACP synthase III [Flavobacterium sp.]|jgi:3-oxoacyl-[acyl-carrier-protein] synthase-3